MVELIVCTECDSVITESPCEVIGNGVDVLIEGISHRRTLVADAERATTYV